MPNKINKIFISPEIGIPQQMREDNFRIHNDSKPYLKINIGYNHRLSKNHYLRFTLGAEKERTVFSYRFGNSFPFRYTDTSLHATVTGTVAENQKISFDSQKTYCALGANYFYRAFIFKKNSVSSISQVGFTYKYTYADKTIVSAESTKDSLGVVTTSTMSSPFVRNLESSSSSFIYGWPNKKIIYQFNLKQGIMFDRKLFQTEFGVNVNYIFTLYSYNVNFTPIFQKPYYVSFYFLINLL